MSKERQVKGGSAHEQARGFPRRNIYDYDFVYTGRIDALNAVFDPSLDMICDQIYREFNEHHPEDYTGRSISVSDIIILRYRGDVSVFYVNPFEFTELPDFLVDD